MNLEILASKLHRHKISYSKENGEIVIGKAKRDLVTYIGLGILPLAFGIGIIAFILLKIKGFRMEMLHIFAAAFFLIGIGYFNLWKNKRKRLANSFSKVIKKDSIIIQTPSENFHLNANTIQHIRVTNQALDKENYEGNLFIIDNENRIHHILGFHDDNERYVSDDLQWFAKFILTQIAPEKTIDITNNRTL